MTDDTCKFCDRPHPSPPSEYEGEAGGADDLLQLRCPCGALLVGNAGEYPVEVPVCEAKAQWRSAGADIPFSTVTVGRDEWRAATQEEREAYPDSECDWIDTSPDFDPEQVEQAADQFIDTLVADIDEDGVADDGGPEYLSCNGPSGVLEGGGVTAQYAASYGARVCFEVLNNRDVPVEVTVQSKTGDGCKWRDAGASMEVPPGECYQQFVETFAHVADHRLKVQTATPDVADCTDGVAPGECSDNSDDAPDIGNCHECGGELYASGPVDEPGEVLDESHYWATCACDHQRRVHEMPVDGGEVVCNRVGCEVCERHTVTTSQGSDVNLLSECPGEPDDPLQADSERFERTVAPTGPEVGADDTTCNSCGGSGEIELLTSVETCEQCGGSGEVT